MKLSAELLTPLQPHQQRLIDKLKASGGLLVAHGVGSGKCVRGDTPVLTERGLLPIRSLFPKELPDAEAFYPADRTRVLSLVKGDWRWTDVKARYAQKLSDSESTRRVQTVRGHTLRVTNAHPLPVVREGKLCWVASADVKVGDWLVVPATLPATTEVVIDPKLAVLLAWQVGEGWEQSTSGTATITQHNREVLERLQGLFKTLYPTSTSGHIRLDERLEISCKAYRQDLEALGYIWGKKSADKKLPDAFIHWPLETLRAALQALFDAEGYVGPANVELTSKSKALVHQIEYALLRFGVRSATHEKWARATNGTSPEKQLYHRLSISGDDYRQFFAEGLIGYERKLASATDKKGNANYGVPIAWLFEALEEMGISRKIFGFTQERYQSCDWKTAQTAVKLIRRRVYVPDPPREGRGTAAGHSRRSYIKVFKYQDELLDLANRLEILANPALRYEPVVSNTSDELGGYVFDLSVDADDYDAQNYVAGEGGFLIHNTLSSIAAANALGLPMEAITPAPLQENYEKEMRKHLGERPADARVRSYEKTVRDGDVNPNALVVMDEAHRARNTNTALSEIVARQAAHAKARMLLTGTPVYNQASDLANLLNTAAGRKVLPDDPAMFKKTFVGEKKIEAPFLTRMKGKILGHEVDDVTVPTLLNRDRLVNAAKGYVDVHNGGGEGFPDREDETHEVELSDRQHRMYKFHEGQMPWYLKAKVRAGLPLSKQESTELNAFQGALRQVANTARAYDASMTDEDERASTPKIQKMVDHLEEMLKKNPNHRGVMYSNFLDSGLKPLQRELVRRGIAHHLFTGEVGKNERDQMVRDYNAGKTPVLLLSGAGSEGLDLKGTRSIQLMEPHWNDSRIDQVIGRGIRYQSHAHLPPSERKTKVMRYFSTLPTSRFDQFEQKILGQKPQQGIEQYLKTTSDYKKNLSDQIRSALQEASDAGPLQRRTYETPKTAAHDDVMERLIAAIGDAELRRKGRADLIHFNHPAQLGLDSPYDSDFVRSKLDSDFGGDPQRMGEQLRDDFTNAGYAVLGDVAKKNEQKRMQRGAMGALYGSLLGMPAGWGVSAMTGNALLKSKHFRKLPVAVGVPLYLTLPALAAGTTTLAAGSLGRAIGRATYKPFNAEDAVAKHTHPLLMPPKEIKAKTKLEIRE